MQSNDKIIVILVQVTGVITLFSMISFVGLGKVREVPLYYQEKVEQTVAFEEVNGETITTTKGGNEMDNEMAKILFLHTVMLAMILGMNLFINLLSSISTTTPSINDSYFPTITLHPFLFFRS